MIHQLIFAAPKPGMTEEEFQRYWRDVHAVVYASKIPQIRKYKIDTRFPLDLPTAQVPWGGAAEIWLENDEEALASLQTDEFLHGARADEPNWAAFWLTVVIDSEAHDLVTPPATFGIDGGAKLMRLVKRREGLSLAEFRERSLAKYTDLLRELPGLRGLMVNQTRDGMYGFGEAVLDGAFQLWFDDEAALKAALASPQFQEADQELLSFVEPKYIHDLGMKEFWIIGPQPR